MSRRLVTLLLVSGLAWGLASAAAAATTIHYWH